MHAPRLPADVALFDKTFHPEGPDASPRLDTRAWALTNTRYLLGIADLDSSLNRAFDPVLRRFRPIERFNFVRRRGVSQPQSGADIKLIEDPDGPYCLFEFTGALPLGRSAPTTTKPSNNWPPSLLIPTKPSS
jgi:hypothetical protein